MFAYDKYAVRIFSRTAGACWRPEMRGFEGFSGRALRAQIATLHARGLLSADAAADLSAQITH